MAPVVAAGTAALEETELTAAAAELLALPVATAELSAAVVVAEINLAPAAPMAVTAGKVVQDNLEPLRPTFLQACFLESLFPILPVVALSVARLSHRAEAADTEVAEEMELPRLPLMAVAAAVALVPMVAKEVFIPVAAAVASVEAEEGTLAPETEPVEAVVADTATAFLLETATLSPRTGEVLAELASELAVVLAAPVVLAVLARLAFASSCILLKEMVFYDL